MATGKTLEAFEAVHGGPKIDRLQRELATERAKVEALADVQNRDISKPAMTAICDSP